MERLLAGFRCCDSELLFRAAVVQSCCSDRFLSSESQNLRAAALQPALSVICGEGLPSENPLAKHL